MVVSILLREVKVVLGLFYL